ncbi:magnesium and cobalt transport protein CorA [Paraphotobacterium marinum]|uniref:Magnesium transport protein CorA n=1 Tax=Paraphotobacterium marinum TaxID=1755811 RepID=A0A220VGV7_9GAMM|nr:magnesium/cobalt transporter CorA [Paraphotobacterium marinum]ASK79595.1 magnesium and cobalt transport protein CorA [Paraphotobacterium marinum]
MINAFKLEGGQLKPTLNLTDKDLKSAVWIDVFEPTEHELELLNNASMLPIPDIDEVTELEGTSHHEEYDGGFQINCLFMHRKVDEVLNINVAFIINEQSIITLADDEVPELRLLRNRIKKGLKTSTKPKNIFLDLLEMKFEQLGESLQDGYRRLNHISKQVLNVKSKLSIENSIEELAREDDIIGKTRLCLIAGQKDLLFLLRKKNQWLGEDNQIIHELLADLETLLPHNTYLSEKVDFLLNATQGFINIEQNQIIKIFSIMAVVFLPPTMIASIYGMNFSLMPELNWKYGYEVTLILMLISGVAPYLFFKIKGYL